MPEPHDSSRDHMRGHMSSHMYGGGGENVINNRRIIITMATTNKQTAILGAVIKINENVNKCKVPTGCKQAQIIRAPTQSLTDPTHISFDVRSMHLYHIA